MAATLNKQAMPIGWESRLDPRTGRFYFINHSDHITTWEDPRLQPKYNQPQGENIALQDLGVIVNLDEKVVSKVCMQFPTVDEGYIRKLLKKYKNRENVVASALMSEGHPRAATHNTPELPARSSARVTVPVDQKLAMKLRSIFPTVDEEWLYSLLSRHNNKEEDVVASLVSAGYPFTHSPFQTSRGSRNSSGQSSPKMKLRYLKGVFPQVDEAVLFDVLINCDNQTQDSISRLTAMGYQKKDSPVPKPSSKSNAEEESKARVPPPQTYNVAIDKVKVKQKLKAEFSEVSEMVVNMALESAKFNETKARQLLQAMTPQDSRPSIGFESPKIAEDLILSTLKRSRPPSTGDSSASSIASQPSTMDKKQANVTSSRLSLASKMSDGSPKPPPRTKGFSDVKRLSYDLQESKENKAESESYHTHAKGPDLSLRKGPNQSLLRSTQPTADGPKSENRKGINPEFHKGPDKSNLHYSGSRLAKGPQKSYCQGSSKKTLNSKSASQSSHFQGSQKFVEVSYI